MTRTNHEITELCPQCVWQLVVLYTEKQLLPREIVTFLRHDVYHVLVTTLHHQPNITYSDCTTQC